MLIQVFDQEVVTAPALEYRVLRPNSRFNRFEWFISQKVLPNSGLFLTVV